MIPDFNLQELTEHWAQGRIIYTVEMGDLHAQYEKGIQVLAFDTLSKIVEMKMENKSHDDYAGILNETAQGLHTDYGLSGEQAESALNIVCMIMEHGYKKALEKAPEDRIIRVSRSFPVFGEDGINGRDRTKNTAAHSV